MKYLKEKLLSHTPSNTIKYIYLLQSGNIAKKFSVGSAASETEFSINGAVITVPTNVTGKIYVEYEYESTSGIRIVNNTENFPKAVGVKIFAIFRDQCNENIKYAGAIGATKGKLDPSSIDTALTATGKHSFAVDFMKDYCDESADLFSVVISE